jgi:hypothetical protein
MSTVCNVIEVVPNGLTLDLGLEDDADSIAQDARELRNGSPAND